MNKCLVTTLKASTNNEALSKYNVLTIKTKAIDSPNLSTQWISIGASYNGSVSVNSPSVGMYKSGISGELLPYPLNISPGQAIDSHFENKEGIVEITNKYNINHILTGTSSILRIKEIYGMPGTIKNLSINNIEEEEIDATKLSNALNISSLEDINTSSIKIVNRMSKNRVAEFISIKRIYPSFSNLFENISLNDVSNNVNVTELFFGGLNGGNLSSFAKMTKLISIVFLNEYQNTGDIMDFITPWIQAGRTSGKLKTMYMRGQVGITLNGSPITFPEGSYGVDGTCYINWTSDGTVTFTAS